MNDQEQNIKELEFKLSECESKLKTTINEQLEAAKLLIRRDLALSRANEQLQVLDVAKSEFISVAAHQLRTPLTAVKWILYMLLKNEFKSSEAKTEFTEKAAKSTERLIELVNDLLEVDHIQSGKYQFVFEMVDVKGVINSILSELQPLIEKNKITINSTFDSDDKVNGDPQKLRALFQNLIENAIKYSKSGSAVNISIETIDQLIKIQVKDSGIGIPDDQKYRIFSKFFRASNAMKLETVGSGLGLFIAKEVVERHGGKIWFDSKPGEGTSFFVELPIYKENAK